MADTGVGIIGAGGIAALSHLPELHNVEGMKVVNIAGRTESRLKALCQRFDIPRFRQQPERPYGPRLFDQLEARVVEQVLESETYRQWRHLLGEGIFVQEHMADAHSGKFLDLFVREHALVAGSETVKHFGLVALLRDGAVTVYHPHPVEGSVVLVERSPRGVARP